MPASLVIGVISDTHGLMRPQALEALAGCDRIIHAGDVGDAAVLEALGAIAPVTAVRGNIDKGEFGATLPETAIVEAGGRTLYMLHDIAQLDLDPAAAGHAAIVYGHSHVPKIETRHGVLYLNPGSAGPRRFRLPVSLARVRIVNGTLQPELVTLDV